jgi:quercetin dioxygenase-like cupin family protein
MDEHGKENLKERVLNVKDLVAYQRGSVASRMVTFKKSGTITIFSFDEGEGLSEHSAPYDATLLLIDGKAEITIAGVVFPLKEGEMIIMPANKPHAVRGITPFKMMLIMIHE